MTMNCDTTTRIAALIVLIATLSGCGPSPAPPGPVAAQPVKPVAKIRPAPAAAVEATEPTASSTELRLIESVHRNDLAKVVRTELSGDGKFLYATCWNPGSVVVFARDGQTGKLTHVQTIDNKIDLGGATGLALSPDGRFAVVAAFQSKNVILLRRDPQSGKLEWLELAPRKGQDVEFPVAAKFSPDGKFVCIADDGGRPGPGGVRVYRLDGERLVDAGMDQGRNHCYRTARSLAFHPDGKTLFVASCHPGALVVADFDRETGGLKIRQILWAARNGGRDFSKSDVGEVTGVQGLVDVVPGPDGRFVTTCSGRFRGPTSVASFRYQDDGHLSFVQAVKSYAGKFVGGNQLAVSPDGRSVYAAGTLSGVVACAGRDPAAGTLTPRGVVPVGGPPASEGATMRPAGVTISHDGKFVYVATEDKSSIAIFRRNP
jgi:6-phosphogluconolactonase (cycloisomerase 2 family)